MHAEPLPFIGRARDSRPARLTLVFPADAQAVRRALKQARDFLRASMADPEGAGVVELVLAEILNNIAEHGSTRERRAVIELGLSVCGERVDAVVNDDGLPLPGGKAPLGFLPETEGGIDSLPEGGFGWFIIRELTSSLIYRRRGGRNAIRFSVSFQDCARGSEMLLETTGAGNAPKLPQSDPKLA